MLDKNTCFFCGYYHHDNPDEDKCFAHDEVVYYDTPACDDFVEE